MIKEYKERLKRINPIMQKGRVSRITGLIIEGIGPSVVIGEKCHISTLNNEQSIVAEVVGFRDERVLLMPLGQMSGIGPGSIIYPTGKMLTVGVGPDLLGRVLDGLGRPIDGKGPLYPVKEYSVNREPLNPLERKRIQDVFKTGVAAIDSLITCGQGQRIGIFSGSGVGKSTLMGMTARNALSDINVIALIGERGREVKEFLDKDLGPEGLKRSVVIVATSDQPALVRLKGAMLATTIAEYFRDEGQNVLLLMDSITRYAMAQREVGLAVGEPPATKGYTPSVFSLLPRLLERTGTSRFGSITGFYTILVESDEMNEPISDAVRAILDGHIVLSRNLATQYHYPAIDVLESISRVMIDIVSPEHRKAAGKMREIIATYKGVEDLIQIGAYVAGSDPRVDYSVKMINKINDFLKQDVSEKRDYNTTVNTLLGMVENEKIQV